MAASSSSTVDELSPQHQVFINYCGMDLRYGFVSHLVKAMAHDGVHVFSNDDVDPYHSLVDRLMKTRIALVILSENYTKTGQCLEELMKIKECMEEGTLVVIPIFYKLEVSTVRHMRGAFGDAFRDLQESDKRKRMWEKALKSTTQLLGITVHEKSYEASAIDEIMINVKSILTKGIEYSRDKDTNFPTGKFVARPADFFDRTSTKSSSDAKVQVFINFRGEQLRNNFISFLVDALTRSKVNVFADNYLHIGDDLTKLFKKIEDSGIAVVVFSSRYPESKWCLDELVKINERVDQDMLKVIPIFYKVTPTDVKRLKGKFGDNFRDREWQFESDEPKIKRWKEAIKSVSNKRALTFDEKSDALEIDFVNSIVTEIVKTLQTIS